ncbi:probable Cytochrome P450 monooxygenase/Phenylacetate hydroxylase [Sporisorium scitamineum]|uniref:Probable Cytochrome P450 monooxygenase/Phenylacetate hydroxylase n=2 Tax=Sporisorium scitamineum TaxID=49012 RepID=A0A127Z4D4_9BASI|nr:probable Cytochrome P450 monooxygenase/Phenylacetate hydroxylase [Sporisorium scitamineum]
MRFELTAETLSSIPHIAWLGLALLLFHLIYTFTKKPKLALPGPRGYPYIGNLLQLGPDPAQTYHKWSLHYGPIYKVQLGERDVIIINTAQAAKHLLTDLGSVYISRPLFYTFHTVVSSTAGYTIGTSPWDDSCKRKRRAAATALNRVAVQSYVPIIDRETLSLVEDLCAAGGRAIEPFAYFQRLALNVSLTVNYGVRLEGVSDALLEEIVEVETHVANFRSVSNSFADYLPIVRYLPWFGGGGRGFACSIRARRDVYMNKLLNDLKQRVKEGTDIPCITGNILKDPSAKLSDEELSSICLSMVSAGLDTLANTFIWSIGFLAKRPDVQQKAYDEIFKVYQGQVPRSDEEAVEYITALHKECSRYFSVLKLALPKATLGDSTYKGVHIPSGTTVFLNAWAIHHDHERYGDVENFRPERFLEPGEENKQSHYSFGAGRRMCAGVHLANRELYVAFCKVIHFFRIERSEVVGEREYDIDPKTGCANPKGLSSSPKPFKVRFVPRDKKAVEGWIEDEKSRTELQMAASIGTRKQG